MIIDYKEETWRSVECIMLLGQIYIIMIIVCVNLLAKTHTHTHKKEQKLPKQIIIIIIIVPWKQIKQDLPQCW